MVSFEHLGHLLRDCARARPDAVAVAVEGGPALTYGAWDGAANAAARGLVARGVEPGSRVVLLFDAARWCDLAVATVAVHRAGAVAVPVAPSFLPAELPRVVAACRPSAVVGPPELGLGPLPVPVVDVATLAAGRDVEAFARPAPVGVSAVLCALGPLTAPTPAPFPGDDAGFDLAAGNGAPGAEPRLTHCFVPGTPAAQRALLAPVQPGGSTAVAVPGLDPGRFWLAVAGPSPQIVGLTGAMARLLLASPAAPDVDLSGVAAVVLAAPAPPPWLVARLEKLFGGARVVADDMGTGVAPPAAVPTAAPAGFAQEGMLWYEEMQPGVFTMTPFVRRMRGDLDVAALERTLAEIVRRHEPFRTTFQLSGGRPVQVLGEPGLRLPVVDLAHLPVAERHAEARRAVAEAATRPLDPATHPPFRASLLRLAGDDHLLVCAVNHVGLDDWSMGVFRRELGTLYASFAAGEPSPLPEPPLAYSEFCRGQHRALTGEEGDRQRSYWRRRLAGAPLTLQLPIGDPGLPEGALQPPGGPLSFVVGPELTARLRALARQERTTGFMAMLAAFSALVTRYTGHDEVLVSTVVAGRNKTELEGMIGCFAKKLVVRASVAGNPTFRQLLAQVRTTLLEALAHPDLPYESVLQHALGEDASAHGLVPSVNLLFQGVAAPRARFRLPGLEPEPFDEDPPSPRPHFVSARSPGGDEEGRSRAWGDGLYAGTFLAVILVEAEDRMTFTVRGAFHPPTVERLLGHFQVLLEDAVANPDRAVPDLALFGERERAELGERTHGPVLQPEGATLAEALAVHARRSPERLAVVSPGGSLTFAELGRRASAPPARVTGDSGLPPEAWLDAVVDVLSAWRAGTARGGHDGSRAAVLVAAAGEVLGEAGGDHGALRLAAVPAPGTARFLRQVAALVAGHNLHLLAGGPDSVVEALARGQVDAVEATLDELDALLAGGLGAALAARDAAHPRPVLVVTTPGRVPPERWEELRAVTGARVVLVLVPAAGHPAAASVVVGDAGPRPVVGRPLPGVACHVLDRSGGPVPVGVVGDLHVEVLGAGARPTGELARHLPGGALELLGRRADTVDLRGFRVDTARIEAALAGRAGTREVAVSLDAHTQAAPRLVAHVVAEGDEVPTPQRLRRLLWDVLPGYACPSVVVALGALPRGAGGEVDRARLTAPPPAAAPAGPRTVPTSRQEALLGACWADVLGVEEVPPATGYWHDFSFLAAAADASRAGERVRVEDLNRARTLELLAAVRSAGSPDDHTSLAGFH